MTSPYEYVDSPYRCLCGKRMIAEYGQHESDGDLVEAHHCLHCNRTYQTRDRTLLLSEVPEPVRYANLEQYVELRTRHVDRPEFLLRQPGLTAIVRAWA